MLLRLQFLLVFLVCSAISLTANSQPKPPRPTDFINELWYKNNVLYNLDVKVFQDSDGDGVGDFRGLTTRLDYLKDLGIGTIWLSPFHPSPNEDDGYDITDFYGIDSRLGTMQDMDAFLRQAKKLGFRVIMDLVINHSSDQHPWFQEARKNKNSKYRDWYVWSEKRPRDADKGMVFPGPQKETWTYDSLAREHYFHRFFRFQPDLNAQNPEVQAEHRKIIKFWLDKGIDGFRLDAVPFLIEVPRTNIEKPDLQFDLLMWLRQYVQWQKGDALLLGETNVEPKVNKMYFGENGEGMQTMFNFYANQFLFYSFASEEVKTLVEALEATKTLPVTAQWSYFLRNHDEIDLDRLSKKQQKTVFDKMGPEEHMQLYERGIRRRLAPMLNNPAQLRMAYSILFALPGTPVLRYGEEIGMGDDLSLKERLSVRTPMQWSDGPNAGFSKTSKTIRPVIDKGEYGYTRVNVADQRKDSTSLLNHIRTMGRLWKQHPEISKGEWKVLDSGSKHILALLYQGEERSVVTLHNFSHTPQTARLKVDNMKLKTVHLNSNQSRLLPGTNPQVQLNGYGFGWFEVEE
ncbi:alpha-amylase family protein [Telluribacter sp. SYSU D00476]|uniref:alpha-amylase family protein n=1 Tax=Telluribacter sp. SYSU D00476 TaxID=2811430 RepID=UPI001FF6A9FA|nr:alpha-amylase family protein [Telluribacter sp. SYSU D00476]